MPNPYMQVIFMPIIRAVIIIAVLSTRHEDYGKAPYRRFVDVKIALYMRKRWSFTRPHTTTCQHSLTLRAISTTLVNSLSVKRAVETMAVMQHILYVSFSTFIMVQLMRVSANNVTATQAATADVSVEYQKFDEKHIIEALDQILSKSKLSPTDMNQLDYLLSLHDLSHKDSQMAVLDIAVSSSLLSSNSGDKQSNRDESQSVDSNMAPYCGSDGFNDIYGNCIYTTTSYAKDNVNAPKRYYSNECTPAQWNAQKGLEFARKLGCNAAATLCGSFNSICRMVCRSLFRILVKNYCNGNVNSIFHTDFRTCGTFWCCNYRTTRTC